MFKSGLSYRVIPHSEQEYNTVGDYVYDGDSMEILVSDLGDWRYEYLIAYHELTEIALCKLAGVTLEVINEFDLVFTKNRPVGDSSEPGDDPTAPYYQQHQIATQQEKYMAEQLGVDWDEYDGKIALLMKERAESGQDD
jgi:hypothetical protein